MDKIKDARIIWKSMQKVRYLPSDAILYALP